VGIKNINFAYLIISLYFLSKVGYEITKGNDMTVASWQTLQISEAGERKGKSTLWIDSGGAIKGVVKTTPLMSL
jgi:hypothetical protein